MAILEDLPISHQIGDLFFLRADPQEAAAALVDLSIANTGSGTHVHLANAYTVALAHRDPEYRSVLSNSAINFPDGKPLMWVSRLRGQAMPLRQVRGPQLFLDVMESGIHVGARHFLLGSTPEVLALLEFNLRQKFPDISIVGTMSPPFREPTPRELESRDEAIRESRAHIVWVGLGTPKQDFEALRLAENIDVVAVAIGAAFDFAAGTQPEAPLWMRKIGMEWLFRLATEPRRLWRRYLIGNFQFLRAVVFSR